MIEKRAHVARSITFEDSNFEYDRTHSRYGDFKGIKADVKVKSSLNPNFMNYSGN